MILTFLYKYKKDSYKGEKRKEFRNNCWILTTIFLQHICKIEYIERIFQRITKYVISAEHVSIKIRPNRKYL